MVIYNCFLKGTKISCEGNIKDFIELTENSCLWIYYMSDNLVISGYKL